MRRLRPRWAARGNAVLVVKVDIVGFQPLQRRFDYLLDVRWLAIEALGRWVEAKLGGNDDLVAKWGQRLAHHF